MSKLMSRLKRLERQPLFQEQCSCPALTTHWRQPDGTIVPPYPPCLHPTGVCPEDGRRRDEIVPIRRIIFGMAAKADGSPDPDREPWVLDDERFIVNGAVRVIVWRDEAGKLCYYGPPRWHDRPPRPMSLIKGPNVPATMEQVIDELKRTDETPAGTDQLDDLC